MGCSFTLLHQRALPSTAAVTASTSLSVWAQTSQAQGGLWVETCLRRFWIGAERPSPSVLGLLRESGVEVFEGAEAYEKLLRISCGLESKLVGETEIFGQIKAAWKLAESCRPSTPMDSAFAGWIQKLFEDTKEIRAQFLQGSGNSSYGALVRRVLNGAFEQPLLLIGAGQLAHSLMPWLRSTTKSRLIQIWNRTPDAALQLAAEFPEISIQPVADLNRALADAHNVVVCVPVESTRDQAWLEQWGHRADGIFIHLGGKLILKSDAGPNSHVYDLDRLFQLQNNLDEVKSIQVERAIHACRTKAKLRAMGGMAGHGWEDLAEFA